MMMKGLILTLILSPHLQVMECSPQFSRRFIFTSFWNSHPNPNRWILSKSHPFQSISSDSYFCFFSVSLERFGISSKSFRAGTCD
ncbi:hypothetical protein L1987_08769 [Smallanthus sonchifolius]|uniref:Uncharacterized protein n=1 Tax=Smallanthus sonchifolius TaxID=185202 RepID=A0ACB9JM37_9ASTR|nr:hypothetical protein L1987_08769 [Smallanthus sonchifolius]